MGLMINYEGGDLNKIKKEIASAHNSVGNYFGFKNNPNITVNIHKSRGNFNKRLGRKTRRWEVANASNNGEINILNPNIFSKESDHSKDEFSQILKHEIAHIFINKLSKNNTVPKWLNEGLASYIAGQHKTIKLTSDNIEKDLCRKLGTPREWNKYEDHFAYPTASLFVGFLFEKYSLARIKKLISSLNKDYDYQGFKKTFKKIFKKDLEGVEKEFIKELDDIHDRSGD